MKLPCFTTGPRLPFTPKFFTAWQLSKGWCTASCTGQSKGEEPRLRLAMPLSWMRELNQRLATSDVTPCSSRVGAFQSVSFEFSLFRAAVGEIERVGKIRQARQGYFTLNSTSIFIGEKAQLGVRLDDSSNSKHSHSAALWW